MRKFTIGLALAATALLSGQATAQVASRISLAGPNDLRVLAINSIRTALERGMADAEKATGHHIVLETGTAGGNLKTAAMKDEGFEVALLTSDVNAELIKAGKAQAGETPIAVGRMGFALRGDAKVDVSTPDAIRLTLVNAKSVVFSPQSSGRPSIDKMFAAAGVTEAMIKHNAGRSPEVKLAPGEYELILYPMSEIIAWETDWKNLGPFPAAYQVPVAVKAVVGAKPRDPAATRKLMAYLTSPRMTAILKEDGWMR